MNPRTLIAVQFALWAFFFGRLIPFSGDFLLPIIWIYDKRIFAGYVIVDLVQLLRVIPFAISVIPMNVMNQIPGWIIPFMGPLTMVEIGASMTFTTWMTSFWLRRKIRKLAPDLTRFHLK